MQNNQLVFNQLHTNKIDLRLYFSIKSLLYVVQAGLGQYIHYRLPFPDLYVCHGEG